MTAVAQSARGPVLAGFAAVLLVLAGAAGLALRGEAELDLARAELAQAVEPAAQAAAALEGSVLRRAVAVRNLVLTGDSRHRHAYDAELERARALLAGLSRAPLDPDGRAALDALVERARVHVAETDAFLAAVARGAAPEELGAAERELATAREQLVARVRAFSAGQQARQQAARARVAELEAGQRRALLAGALALAAALLGAALGVAGFLRRRTVALARAADAAEAGDYAPARSLARTAAAARARGELGRLAAAVARLADRLRRQEDRLAADARIGAAVASSVEPQAIAAAVLAEVAAHVRAAVGAVYVLEGEALVRAAGHGGPEVLAREGVVAEALDRGRAVRLAGIPTDLPFAVRAGFGDVRPRSVVAVPLAARGERLGVLLLGSLGELDDEALCLAERAGTSLGVALQGALAQRRLAHLPAAGPGRPLAAAPGGPRLEPHGAAAAVPRAARS